MAKDLIIRSSTEEFITFKLQEKDKGIQVRYENETLWMTQKAMAELFDVEQPAIAKHLINIYKENELDKASTYSKMELVQKEGTRNVKRNVEFYNLDAIISVGYRVNSIRATQFRRWATNILKTFTIQGYVFDKERMKNRARRHIPMTMEDWDTRIDKFLLADDRDILKDAGKISHEIAKDKALTEFEKYRVKQDKLYKSDFDLLMEESEKI